MRSLEPRISSQIGQDIYIHVYIPDPTGRRVAKLTTIEFLNECTSYVEDGIEKFVSLNANCRQGLTDKLT